MEQILVGGRPNATVSATKRYGLEGNGPATTDGYQMVAADGYLKELRVITNIAPGLGKSYTFTVYLNEVITPLAVRISGAVDTSGSDMTDTVLVKPGDRIYLYVTMAGVPVAPLAIWSSIFESINPKESLIVGGQRYSLNTGAVRYSSFGGGSSWSSLEAARTSCVSAKGTIRNLYIEIMTAPGVGASWTFVLRVNGVATALSVKIEDLATTGSDVADADAIAVVPGDRISIRCTPAGPPAACLGGGWGALFVADVDGESLLLGSSDNNALNTVNVDNFYWINIGGNTPIGLVDATVNRLTRACTLSNLYVKLRNAPGAGDSYTFMVRKQSVDTTLTCLISGAVDTAGNETTTTVACLIDEVLNMKVSNAGAPGADNYASWGLKVFIQPKEIMRNFAMVRKLGLPTPINIGMGI